MRRVLRPLKNKSHNKLAASFMEPASFSSQSYGRYKPTARLQCICKLTVDWHT